MRSANGTVLENDAPHMFCIELVLSATSSVERHPSERHDSGAALTGLVPNFTGSGYGYTARKAQD